MNDRASSGDEDVSCINGRVCAVCLKKEEVCGGFAVLCVAPD